MRFEELRVPAHVTGKELMYAKGVVLKIRDLGYPGLVDVVGSREHGFHISTNHFTDICNGLSKNDRWCWFHFLNDLVIKREISAGEIPGLVDYLPENAPIQLREFLKKINGPDSDLDILLTGINRLGRIKPIYLDKDLNGSGLAVELIAGKLRNRRNLHDLYLK